MSQISVHNDSLLATIHSSNANIVKEAVKHLTAVLRLLRPQDQLKMMVRLESLLSWDDHIRYLAVVSAKVFHHSQHPGTGSDLLSHAAQDSFREPPEEFCILGFDVPVSHANPLLNPTTSSLQTPSSSSSAPGSPQKAQRSHSSISPDQHQGIGSRIASRTRKFLTLPKQKSQAKSNVAPSPRLAKRPSIPSSMVVKLDELPDVGEEGHIKVHIGLALPITGDLKISLDGDGGFRVENRKHHHIFKPVSVQAMWSVLQTLLKASENARHHSQQSVGLSGHRILHTSTSSSSLTTTSSNSGGSSMVMESCSMVTTSYDTASSNFNNPSSSMCASHGWVENYFKKIDSMWVKEWHLILEDFLSLTADHGGGTANSRRPLSPQLSRHRQQVYSATEMKIRQHLREVMLTLDLEQVNSKEIRQRVESTLKMNLSDYKSFIDHEILVILGQMDSASEIFDHLYLGTEWNAGNLDELRKKQIALVLNVTTEINNFFPNMFDYKNIRVNDTEEEDMLQHWEEAVRFIAEAKREGKKVLVHCKMGVSRSASVVIAYAMKANDWNLDEALQYVKARRNCIQPNPGFMRQLEVYQGILEASKHRSSWQSATTGSTLSLNESKSPKCSYSELDDLCFSNLRRASSEFFSAPNLSPSVPLRSESLRRSSRPATFYFANDNENSKSMVSAKVSKETAKSKKTKKGVKWEAIEENVSKEEPDDTFGMLRVVLEPLKTENFQKSRSVSDSSELDEKSRSFSEQFSIMRQNVGAFSSTTIPKVKLRQSRQNASSIFGLGNITSNSSVQIPVKENKFYSVTRRPASIHVSSYLKPKDPVQTLVKYFDELTLSPHSSNPAPQAAQV